MSHINLMPNDYIERRLQQRTNSLGLVLFGVVMLCIAGTAFVSRRATNHTLAVAERVDADYALAAKMIGEMRQLEARKQMLLEKAEMTASLLERIPRSTIVAVITNALPAEACLTSMEMVPVKSFGGPSAAGKFDQLLAAQQKNEFITTIQVSGVTSTDVEVANFMSNLADCPLLSAVDLVFSQEKFINKMSVREFKVTMIITPGMDAMEVLSSWQKPKQPTAPQAQSDQNGAQS